MAREQSCITSHTEQSHARSGQQRDQRKSCPTSEFEGLRLGRKLAENEKVFGFYLRSDYKSQNRKTRF